jgi:Domain of unknown function (DUF4304)
MSRVEITKELQECLRGHGFSKNGLTWNRRIGDFVDVIDLQISKSSDQITSNVGVTYQPLHDTVWSDVESNAIQEASCVYRARLFDLAGEKFTWLDLDAPEAGSTFVKAIETVALPKLQDQHNLHSLLNALEAELGSSYPIPKIYYAVLMFFIGEREKALAALHDLRAANSVALSKRVDVVESNLRKL